MKLKIPYFRQETNTTCGVACVKMVLAFHGKEISEIELEDACETSWLGNTSGELVSGIKKLGFEAEEIEHVTPKYLSSQLDKKYPSHIQPRSATQEEATSRGVLNPRHFLGRLLINDSI